MGDTVHHTNHPKNLTAAAVGPAMTSAGVTPQPSELRKGGGSTLGPGHDAPVLLDEVAIDLRASKFRDHVLRRRAAHGVQQGNEAATNQFRPC